MLSLRWVVALGFFALVGWESPSFAEEKNWTDILGRLSAAQGHMVQTVIAQQQKGLGCKDYALQAIESVAGIRLPKNEKGEDGWWTARYSGTACGMKVLSNVEFDMREGVLKVAPLVPGDTRADPVLQADVKKSFAMAVAPARKADCKENFRIRNTTVVEQPKKANSPWREVWVGTACRQDFGQVVTFLPNDKGVGFTMALPKTGIRKQEPGTGK